MAVRKYTWEQILEAAHEKEGMILTTPQEFEQSSRLSIRCKAGHQWNTVPANLIDGRWCKHCYQMNRSSSKKKACVLRLQCFQGHEWEPTPLEILQDAKCPQCKPKKTAPTISLLSSLGRMTYKKKD